MDWISIGIIAWGTAATFVCFVTLKVISEIFNGLGHM